MAFSVTHRDCSGFEPMIDTVTSTDTKFNIEALSRFYFLHPLGNDSVFVFRMKLFKPAVTQLFFFRYTGISDPLFAEIVAGTVNSASPKQLGQRFNQLSEASFTIVHEFFSTIVLGSIFFSMLTFLEHRFQLLHSPTHGFQLCNQLVLRFAFGLHSLFSSLTNRLRCFYPREQRSHEPSLVSLRPRLRGGIREIDLCTIRT